MSISAKPLFSGWLCVFFVFLQMDLTPFVTVMDCYNEVVSKFAFDAFVRCFYFHILVIRSCDMNYGYL